ncbi:MULTISPECIES: MFS transporter [unclassified Bradyrhizobium]
MDASGQGKSAGLRLALPGGSLKDKKWLILTALFLGRCIMGMQFQSVGSLAPLLKAQDIDYGQLGVLIGAYLAPGVLLCLPGGIVVSRLGDRASVIFCLVLMACGGALELHGSWMGYLAARSIAGAGGVVLAVAATKMIADRFSGRNLGLAMAVFVNAWPCGIALSLVCLPPIAQSFGLLPARAFLLGLVVVALLLNVLLIPNTAGPGAVASVSLPRGLALLAISVVGVLWGIANAAFATVFGFGPALLVEKGFVASVAGSYVSIVLWMSLLSIPAGGIIVSRLSKPGGLIVLSLAVAAGALVAVPHMHANIGLFVLIGIVSGLPGGAMMTLPAQVLTTEIRAVGMGVFYTISYAIMLSFPVLQGLLARSAGSASITFDTAAVAMLLAIPVFGVFALLVRRPGGDLATEPSS